MNKAIHLRKKGEGVEHWRDCREAHFIMIESETDGVPSFSDPLKGRCRQSSTGRDIKEPPPKNRHCQFRKGGCWGKDITSGKPKGRQTLKRKPRKTSTLPFPSQSTTLHRGEGKGTLSKKNQREEITNHRDRQGEHEKGPGITPQDNTKREKGTPTKIHTRTR